MSLILIAMAFAPSLSLHAQNKVRATYDTKKLSCKLTNRKLQQRKQTVLADLKAKVTQKRELENGFGYTFAGTDEMLDLLTLFIKTERQCCDFFDYHFLITGSSEQIEMSITGPAGVRDFIREELGL